MNQVEAMRALLDGKKITCPLWNLTKYIHVVGNNVVTNLGTRAEVFNIEYELYKEQISFEEALAGLKSKKYTRIRRKGHDWCVTLEESDILHTNHIFIDDWVGE